MSGPLPPVRPGEPSLLGPAEGQADGQVLWGGRRGTGVCIWGQAHREGVPVLDGSGNAGSFPGASDPAERQSVTVQGVQGELEALSGGVPAEGRRQGAQEHTGGDKESREEQDPTAACSPDWRMHDRGAPEEGEQGSCQAQAQLMKATAPGVKKPKPNSKPDINEFGPISMNSPPQTLQSNRDNENELAHKGRKPRHHHDKVCVEQDVHVAETPG